MKQTQAQISAMDRLLKKHGEVKVRQVIAFAHQSDFWITHVHTPVYLERKFETLLAQMLAPHKASFFQRQSKEIKLPSGKVYVPPQEGMF